MLLSEYVDSCGYRYRERSCGGSRLTITLLLQTHETVDMFSNNAAKLRAFARSRKALFRQPKMYLAMMRNFGTVLKVVSVIALCLQVRHEKGKHFLTQRR